MDFDSKTTKLHCQEVDEYLTKNGVHLSPRFKVEFCPQGTDFTLPPPNGGAFMHSQILALGLKLPLTKFVLSVLSHFRIAPRNCRGSPGAPC